MLAVINSAIKTVMALKSSLIENDLKWESANKWPYTHFHFLKIKFNIEHPKTLENLIILTAPCIVHTADNKPSTIYCPLPSSNQNKFHTLISGLHKDVVVVLFFFFNSVSCCLCTLHPSKFYIFFLLGCIL